MSTRITITNIRHGQPRAYADTEGEDTVLFERPHMHEPDAWRPDDYRTTVWAEADGLDVRSARTRDILKSLINWYDPGDPGDDWAATHLSSITVAGPGLFRVLTRATYND